MSLACPDPLPRLSAVTAKRFLRRRIHACRMRTKCCDCKEIPVCMYVCMHIYILYIHIYIYIYITLLTYITY
jgi:hypothetical protein